MGALRNDFVCTLRGAGVTNGVCVDPYDPYDASLIGDAAHTCTGRGDTVASSMRACARDLVRSTLGTAFVCGLVSCYEEQTRCSDATTAFVTTATWRYAEPAAGSPLPRDPVREPSARRDATDAVRAKEAARVTEYELRAALSAELRRIGVEIAAFGADVVTSTGAGDEDLCTRTASVWGETVHDSLVECARTIGFASGGAPVEIGRMQTRAFLRNGCQLCETSVTWHIAVRGAEHGSGMAANSSSSSSYGAMGAREGRAPRLESGVTVTGEGAAATSSVARAHDVLCARCPCGDEYGAGADSAAAPGAQGASCGAWTGDAMSLTSGASLLAESATFWAVPDFTPRGLSTTSDPAQHARSTAWRVAYSLGGGNLFTFEIDAVSVLAPSVLAALRAHIDSVLEPWRSVSSSPSPSPGMRVSQLRTGARVVAFSFGKAHGQAIMPLDVELVEGAVDASAASACTLWLVLRTDSRDAAPRAYARVETRTLASSLSASIDRPFEYARALVLGAGAGRPLLAGAYEMSAQGEGLSPHVAALECKRALLANSRAHAARLQAGETRISATQRGADTLVWRVTQTYAYDEPASVLLLHSLALCGADVRFDEEFSDGDLVSIMGGGEIYTCADNDRLVKMIVGAAAAAGTTTTKCATRVRLRVTETETKSAPNGRWRVEWQHVAP